MLNFQEWCILAKDRMRDIFSEGLLYLDLLELYGSTYTVADICGISQSNVFRGANACAKLLRLDLTKDKQAGTYTVHRNQDVQRDLRKVNQRLRGRENGQLRLLTSTVLPTSLSRETRNLILSLPALSINIADQLELLGAGVVDLLICGRHELPADTNWEPSQARVDLFTPCNGLVASMIGQEPYAVLASSKHPLRSLEQPVRWADFKSIEISLSDEPSLLAWQQRFYQACLPSTCSFTHHTSLNWGGDEEAYPWWQNLADQDKNMVTVIPNHHFLQACDADPSLLTTRLSTKLDPPQIDVVALTTPHLVREPLFRKLMEFLRTAYRHPTTTKINEMVP